MRRAVPLLLASALALALPAAPAEETPDPSLPAFRIDPGDAIRASARANGAGGILRVELQDETRSYFAGFTEAHVGERVQIVVCGHIVAKPVVKKTVSGPVLEIFYPLRKEADAAAKALAAKIPPGAPLPPPPGMSGA